MSWRIARKDGKYRIWSTVSDVWITEWLDRKDVVQFYYYNALFDFKKKAIEQYYKFPHMCPAYDDNEYIYEEEGCKAWVQWMEKLNAVKGPDQYYNLIDETYKMIMKEIEE